MITPQGNSQIAGCACRCLQRTANAPDERGVAADAERWRRLRGVDYAGRTVTAVVSASTLASRAAKHPCRITARGIGFLVPLEFNDATVHSVFARACNIELQDGTLVTVLDRRLGNTPHGVACEVPESFVFYSVVRLGAPVSLRNGELQIDRRARVFDLSHATCWRGAVSSPAIDRSSLDARHVVGRVWKMSQASSLSGGLLACWPSMSEAASPMHAALTRRLDGCLPLLARGTVKRDATSIERALWAMIGLGPGLTPSGDDFIVGYLAALWSQSSRDATLQPLLEDLRAPLRSMTAKTGAISRQFILDASVGQFSEPLVDLVRAIALGNGDHVAIAAARVLRIGHSSGADAVLGLLFGLDPAHACGESFSNQPKSIALDA